MWWIIALLILGNICSLITGTYESPTAATVAVVPIHGSQSVSQAVPHVTRSCPQSVSQSVSVSVGAPLQLHILRGVDNE